VIPDSAGPTYILTWQGSVIRNVLRESGVAAAAQLAVFAIPILVCITGSSRQDFHDLSVIMYKSPQESLGALLCGGLCADCFLHRRYRGLRPLLAQSEHAKPSMAKRRCAAAAAQIAVSILDIPRAGSPAQLDN